MIDDIQTVERVVGISWEQVRILKLFYKIHTGKDPIELKSVSQYIVNKPLWKRCDELIKLGIWAEAHGINVIAYADTASAYEPGQLYILKDCARLALEALPTDSEPREE